MPVSSEFALRRDIKLYVIFFYFTIFFFITVFFIIRQQKLFSQSILYAVCQ